MPTLVNEDVTDAPLEKVFDYLADARNIEQWFYGVEKVVPLTDRIRGLGSTFEITIDAGMKLTAKIQCTEFVENELIAVETYDGPQSSSRWTFAREGDGTRIRGEFDYTLPGGLAGKAMGQLVKPFANVAVKHTSTNLLKYAGR